MSLRSFDPEGLLLYAYLESRNDFLSLAINLGYLEFRWGAGLVAQRGSSPCLHNNKQTAVLGRRCLRMTFTRFNVEVDSMCCSFNVGSGKVVLRSRRPIDDSRWHTIIARRNRKDGMLQVPWFLIRLKKQSHVNLISAERRHSCTEHLSWSDFKLLNLRSQQGRSFCCFVHLVRLPSVHIILRWFSNWFLCETLTRAEMASFQVDDESPVQGTSPGESTGLNLDSLVYVGGFRNTMQDRWVGSTRLLPLIFVCASSGRLRTIRLSRGRFSCFQQRVFFLSRCWVQLNAASNWKLPVSSSIVKL